MGASADPGSAKVLTAYYAATVIFIALDYVLGINVRLAFFDTAPVFKAFYYGLCLTCLALIIKWPAWRAWIATGESLLALSLLIITTATRIIVVTDEMIESGRGFVTMSELANFTLSAGALYLAYLRGGAAIRASGPPG